MEVTLYLVGTDVDDAQANLPYDSWETAWETVLDKEDSSEYKVYTVTATLDFSTMEEVRQ